MTGNKRKKNKTGIYVILFLVLIITAVFISRRFSGGFSQAEQPVSEVSGSESFYVAYSGKGSASSIPGDSGEKGDGFEITMLDVGEGLCLLVESDGEYMIYDGGPRESSSYVVSYMQKRGITEFEYMFASHYDVDHIAGLVGILNKYRVKSIVCPGYTADTGIYSSFYSKAGNSGAEIINSSPGDTYSFGGAVITVLSPEDYSCEEENDRSVAVRIVYGGFSCVITGDAGHEAETYMLSSDCELDCDLYVAGHHGSYTSGSPQFIKAMSPSYAFISCGIDNPYGHPSRRALSSLELFNVQIFRTDIQGEVSCFSDGKTYAFSTDPCDDFTPGTTAYTAA